MVRGIHGILILALLLPVSLFATEYTFYVSPQGSGNMSGSDQDNAMRGLYEAATYVRMHPEITGDDMVTMKVLPGTYHFRGDSLFRWQGWTKPYLIVEGLDGLGPNGETRPLLSGLDEEPLGPWTNLGGNVWVAEWNYDFGWYGNPDNYVCGTDWDGWIGCTIESYVPDLNTGQWRDGLTMLRRELIIQDGERFTQMTMPEFVDIREQTFHTPLEGTGFVRINTDQNPNDVPVYAANCQYLFAARDTRGVELHNLEFAYANPFIKFGMVDISSSETALIKDCEFHHSNADGISVRKMPMRPINPNDPDSDFDYIEEANTPGWWQIDNCYTHDNGFYGMLIAHSKGLLHKNSIVRRNNLRGYESGTMAYDTGGMKMFRCRHSEVTGYLADWNYGAGIWFDLDGRDLILRNSRLEYNYYRGFYIERAPGPILLERVVMENNSQPVDTTIVRLRPSAMGISATDTITVRSCQISDPYRYPIMMHSPDFLLEPGLYAPYGEPEYLQCWNNTFEHCTITRSDPQLPFIWFVVEGFMFRCYYMFHTMFNEMEFQTRTQDLTHFEVVREMVRWCPPVEYGNNYDLRDFYDSPWLDTVPGDNPFRQPRELSGE
ncbi:right-handed parallel beta-helix repeat-containing protein [bacterium]|nr:right-handed parallel beta-helix repeat-containing protein [bacterium]